MMHQTAGPGLLLSLTLVHKNSFQAYTEEVCYDADPRLFGIHINFTYLKSSNRQEFIEIFFQSFFFILLIQPKMTT